MPEIPKSTNSKKKTAPEKVPVYPDVKATLCTGTGAITYDQCGKLLGWETEEEYMARLRKEAEASGDVRKGGQAFVGFGDDYLLKDTAGRKVKCWNNTRNREFREAWHKALAQDLLLSGPKVPVERRRWQFNGEAIIIGMYAQVLSGQHRLTALRRAVELWRADKARWGKYWPTEPVLESLVVVGIDESPRTVRTFDNVKPRSLADVFYTSGLFDKLEPVAKRECSRMLEAGVRLLWTRTGAGSLGQYQTHGESSDFLARHHKLLECVKHLYKVNEERAISRLKLSAGQCAALMYLQGCATSDVEAYRRTRTERSLEWDLAEEAKQFWTDLVKRDRDLDAVHDAIGALADEENGTSGRVAEKHAIIAKAWERYVLKRAINKDLLALEYESVGGDTKLSADQTLGFGGIDLGAKFSNTTETGADPTPEEIEAEKQAIQAARLEQMKETVTKGKGS